MRAVPESRPNPKSLPLRCPLSGKTFKACTKIFDMALGLMPFCTSFGRLSVWTRILCAGNINFFVPFFLGNCKIVRPILNVVEYSWYLKLFTTRCTLAIRVLFYARVLISWSDGLLPSMSRKLSSENCMESWDVVMGKLSSFTRALL